MVGPVRLGLHHFRSMGASGVTSGITHRVGGIATVHLREYSSRVSDAKKGYLVSAMRGQNHPCYTPVQAKQVYPTMNAEEKEGLEKPVAKSKMVPHGKEVVVNISGKPIEAITQGVDCASSP